MLQMNVKGKNGSVRTRMQGLFCADGESDGEGASLVLAFGFGSDLTAVKLYQSLRQGQAEAGPLVVFRVDSLELCEGLKELRQIFGSDPNSRVLHPDFNEVSAWFMVHGRWFMVSPLRSLNPER